MVSQLKNQELIQESINNKFSPEIQLLLLASRKSLSKSNINKIQVITCQVIDWQQVINLAKSHSVIPLVAHNLQKYCARNLPDNVKSILKTEFRSNAIKNIYLSKELLEIVQLLKDNDINYICFKGASLAASIYGDISFRQFNDIDILIPKKDLLKARDLFFSIGGKVWFLNIVTDKKKESFMSSQIAHKFLRHYAYGFEFKNQTVLLDLHWQMFPSDFPLSLSMEYLEPSLEDTIIFNQKISTLSPENNLLLLCGHGSKDCWNKLARICDIAELINFYPQLDWELLIKEGKNRDILRLVLVGLSLANRLYKISLPDFIYEEINQDTKIKSLVNKIEYLLFCESNIVKNTLKEYLALLLFKIQFIERIQDKIKSVFNSIFLPSYGDWALFLPYELPYIFYYFTRPFRLLFKIVFKLKNR